MDDANFNAAPTSRMAHSTSCPQALDAAAASAGTDSAEHEPETLSLPLLHLTTTLTGFNSLSAPYACEHARRASAGGGGARTAAE
ncbi:hypothetical protein FOA52_003664 [Chlamydomonas sp. UWO 241]|nr:hypothetical protein FOA52_003664 [Chlamydomonas sp. UWO 241]